MPLTNTLGWNSQQLLQDILPDPNLVMAMPLNELSGTTYDRCLLNQLTGTPNGSLSYSRPINTYSTGRLLTRTSSQYFTIADNPALSMGDIDFTIVAWVYISSYTSGEYPAITAKWDSGGNLEYLLAINGGSQWPFFSVSPNGTASTTVDWGAAMSAGAWHMVTAKHDSVNNIISIQVDLGTAVTTSHSTGVYDGTSTFKVGYTPTTGNYLNGGVAPIGVWKRCLSTSEITALYRGGNWGASYSQLAGLSSTLTQGCVAYWNMTESSGNAADSAGSNTLTAMNTPTTLFGVVLPEPYDAYGMYFPGLTSSYISLGNTSALGFTQTTPFSILAVTTQTADVSATIINKFYASGDNGWLLQLLSGGNLGKTWFVLKEKTGSQITVLGSTSRSLGTSYMVGVSYDGSNLNTGLVCYNNGTSDVGAQAGGPLGPVPTNSRAACIGVLDSGNSSPFQGGIGLVAVFNSAKTAIDFRRWATLGGFR